MQIHTFHQSAAIWFYWLYTIISKNLSLLSDSIQYIDQLFHLHQTCTHNQTLNYNFRKPFTPLCKSIYSIDQLQSYYIDFTITFRKYPLVEWLHTINQSHVSFTSYLSLQSNFKLSFSKIPCLSMRFHTLFYHLQYDIFFVGQYTPTKCVTHSLI